MDLTSFRMNSLVGTDDEGNDVISMNDKWFVLNEALYRQVFEEMSADNFKELVRLIRIAREVALEDTDVNIHRCKESLPFLLLESPAAIKSLHSDLTSRPGVFGQEDSGDTAHCHRQRVPIRTCDGYCLFPLIIASCPPDSILGSPLIRHELVHLRHTLSERYGESTIRDTFWNMDLQPHIAARFTDYSTTLISSYLEEEWEACGENFSGNSRQEVFSEVYIPLVLDKIATVLDWWLVDLRRYLNFGDYADTVTSELRDVLTCLGYSDSNAHVPMDPERWRRAAGITLRQAHTLWKRQHGSFLDSFRQALDS